MKRTKKKNEKINQNKKKDGTRGEEPYSVQLNGNVSRAPPWPTPQLTNEKMFVLPKKMVPEDKIIVKCETLDQPSVLRIGLVTGYDSPDYRNLACQLEMFFPPANNDRLAITIVQDGAPTTVYEDSAVNFYEGIKFTMGFGMRDDGFMDISIGASHIETVQLMHNVDSIRFLTVNGDISKVTGLDFHFG